MSSAGNRVAWLRFLVDGTLAPAFTLLVFFSSVEARSECKTYLDSQRNEVRLHPRSFVDRVVCPGNAGCPNEAFKINGLDNDPQNTIGPPSYFKKRPLRGSRGIYSLGCKGSATWEFTDNLLVDVPGPDLMVFEIGKAKEATTVEISERGDDAWVVVGRIEGSRTSIDIGPFVNPGDTFRFVRLTDLGTSCRNRTAGADIDAIAAFAFSWAHTEDDTSIVLFDFARAELRDEGKQIFDRYFSDFPSLPSERYKTIVVGHTDSVGTETDNAALSIARAKSVADYLINKSYIDGEGLMVLGHGETRPVADNGTPAGRARNRRVEITFVPRAACP